MTIDFGVDLGDWGVQNQIWALWAWTMVFVVHLWNNNEEQGSSDWPFRRRGFFEESIWVRVLLGNCWRRIELDEESFLCKQELIKVDKQVSNKNTDRKIVMKLTMKKTSLWFTIIFNYKSFSNLLIQDVSLD